MKTKKTKMEVLKRLLPENFPTKAVDIIYECLGGVDCDMLCKAFSPLYRIEMNNDFITDCVENNYMRILKYVYKISENKVIYTANQWKVAAKNGNIEMFDYLVKINNNYNNYNHHHNYTARCNCLYQATANNKIAMLNYLITLEQNDLARINLCPYAAVSGSIAMLQTVINLGCVPNSDTFASVAKSNNFDMLDWLINNGYNSIDYRAFVRATSKKNLSMLKKLHSIYITLNKPFEKNTEITLAAASAGSYPTFAWLMENKYPASYAVISNAAYSGSLRIIQHVYRIAKPEDLPKYFDTTLIYNCITGSAKDEKTVKMLTWLDTIGVKTYTAETIRRTFVRDKVATMEYLLAQGCPLPPDPLHVAISYTAVNTSIRLAQLYGFTLAHVKLAKAFIKLEPLLNYFSKNN